MLKSRGFWIGIAISVVLIALFLRSTSVSDMKSAFEGANPWIVLASLPVYFLGLWVRTIRWQYLLRPVKRVTALRLYPVVIIGLMANNLIPARAGELARAYVLGEREKVSKTAAFGTIAVDRIFDGVTLIPMMLIVASFAGRDASFPVGFGKSLNFAGLGIVMATIFGAATAVLFYMAISESGRDLLHRLVTRFAPRSVKPKVEGLLHSFFDGLAALRSPVDLGIAWLMSLISWTLEATMYYIVARAFSIDEPFYVFLLLTAAANLAIAIVASQGGIGPFEIVVSRTIIAFGPALSGTAKTHFEGTAHAYALGLHVILLVPIVVIGLALMWSMNLTFEAMLRGERQAEAETEALAVEEDAAARTTRPANPAIEGSGPK